MSKGKILVTDTLFISDKHIKQLEKAGYEVERIKKPDATEDELITALKDKVGYILGGIEKVTDKVLASTDTLKAISFTGADWKALITGWETARQRGIKIANAPGANSPAVAEFALTLTLAMQRNLFELGRTGDVDFQTTNTLHNAVVGVIGAGAIGSKIIKSITTLQPSKVLYHTRNKNAEVEDLGVVWCDLETLLSQCEVIIVAAPGTVGTIFDKENLEKVKNDALIVSISPRNHFDFDALYERLEAGTLRAAIDWPAPDDKFLKLPLHIWFNTNNHTAYNTSSVIQICSDMGTEAMINLLEKGDDKNRVL